MERRKGGRGNDGWMDGWKEGLTVDEGLKVGRVDRRMNKTHTDIPPQHRLNGKRAQKAKALQKGGQQCLTWPEHWT